MASKKIAIIVKYFPTISETFIVNQINGLMDTGYSVSLYAYNKVDTKIIHESLKRHNLLHTVTYFVKPPVSKLGRLIAFFTWIFQHIAVLKWKLLLKTLNVFRFGKDAYTLKLFFEAQWFLVPYDFELIHAHFGMNGNRIAYLKTCGILPKDVKHITTFHGYDLEPNKLDGYKVEYNHLFKEADVFTVNTPYLDGLLQQVNSYHKPCYILPVGLDTTFFKKKSIKEDTSHFDLVFCGKMIPLKGPDLAIEIVNQLHKLGYTQVRLYMIGEGELRRQLKNQVHLSHLQDCVFFYGALSQSEIKHRFEQADAFILPGRYDPETGRAETQGLVIQEAQAMGLPVIVSDVGGMKYGLIPNETGFVVKENNIQGFVDAIETLILNEKLKIEMGQKGRDFVRKNFDSTIVLEKLIVLYKKVFG